MDGGKDRQTDRQIDKSYNRFIIRNLAYTIMEAIKPKVFRVDQWWGRPRESQCSS